MTDNQRRFLVKYYKALNGGSDQDQVDCILAAKHLWNEIRTKDDIAEEKEIAKKYWEAQS